MRVLIAIFVALASLNIAEAGESSTIYNKILTGEREHEDYCGPIYPENKERSILKPYESQLLEDDYNNNFLLYNIGGDLSDLTVFIETELPVFSLCPNKYYEKSIDYIRYMYRLQAISYLFEFMKHGYSLMERLGAENSGCDVSWERLFSDCQSDDPEMNKFLRRGRESKVFTRGNKEITVYSDEQKKEFLDQVNSAKTTDNVSAKLIASVINGRPTNISQLVKEIERACEESRMLIRNFCSGQDELYGISYQPIYLNLLLDSNVVDAINVDGFGRGCVRRFGAMFKPIEKRYELVSNIASSVLQLLNTSTARYKQGDAFVPGALKEFDDKGLDDFLFASSAPAVQVAPSEYPREDLASAPPLEVVAEPEKKSEKTVLLPTPIPTPTPIPLSHFEQSVRLRAERDLDITAVDLNLLKSDFVLEKNMLDLLKSNVGPYKTRSALASMKRNHGFGGIDAPVRLLFLRYLLDTNDHQALFNLQSELGNRFFLLNDIEGKQIPVYVELLFDKSRWRLNILRDPK